MSTGVIAVSVWSLSFLFNILSCKYNKWVYDELASPSVKRKNDIDAALCWFVFLSMLPGIQLLYNVICLVYLVGTFLKRT